VRRIGTCTGRRRIGYVDDNDGIDLVPASPWTSSDDDDDDDDDDDGSSGDRKIVRGTNGP
jgi:hypothetical protein